MTKLWKRVKAFIGNRDFADAVKSVADDLKVASLALLGLGLLSLVSKLPASLLPLLAGGGWSAVQVSAWVTWLLFGVAAVLYGVQFWLRVTRLPAASRKHDFQRLQIEKVQNGKPCGRDAAFRSRSHTGNSAGPIATLLQRINDKFNR